MTTVMSWPRMMSVDQAMEYVGGGKILADLRKKELIKPRVQGPGLTRYDRVALDDALDKWTGFDE